MLQRADPDGVVFDVEPEFPACVPQVAKPGQQSVGKTQGELVSKVSVPDNAPRDPEEVLAGRLAQRRRHLHEEERVGLGLDPIRKAGDLVDRLVRVAGARAELLEQRVLVAACVPRDAKSGRQLAGKTRGELVSKNAVPDNAPR
eukprot:SAG22_NODE_13_length_33548_cov_57.167773_26_plen_144_part_00